MLIYYYYLSFITKCLVYTILLIHNLFFNYEYLLFAFFLLISDFIGFISIS